ncbi:23S rRNA pseudouridine(2605) synthase RluB [Enterovibrio norvegicus]|uniref:23S rRNA pseudouridine(2605) synthase RluB n=1 Tax=Enterovibrio norvegicus TaxID=188144 RepID=UPI000C85841D|nr:23S rRNA pseudouridine(2605) synthase RluB [Enterovibrio norvegicus]PML80164.1 23S rRNA pseudouridylate synthase B [Enterovibrio norvegicus]
MSEKLQKVLARAGLGSRREIESMIQAGRVSVNGIVAKLGDRLDDASTNIRVDGHSVQVAAPSEVVCRVLAYNKPEGELCTRSDPEGRRTVFDRLPRMNGARWVAVGRLDANTSGLMLFTTDGELANRLMHPSRQVQREYMVRVFGEVNEQMIKNLVRGVTLEDGDARFEDIVYAGGEGMNHTFYVVITEGRNREVRRLWESQGVTVSRLKRVRYGNLYLNKELPRGGWMELELDDVNYLREMVELRPERETMITPEMKKRKARSQKIRRAVRRHEDRVESTDTRKPRPQRRGGEQSVASDKPAPRRGQGKAGQSRTDAGKPAQRAGGRPGKPGQNRPGQSSSRQKVQGGKPQSSKRQGR